mgnify:CR=1 FL=1|tara:strand:+ start:550 stop:825 length:276 start_codon:yes stop_codon:yes gene_type:complete
MNIFIKSLKSIGKQFSYPSLSSVSFVCILICTAANSGQTYYEGQEAESIIKSGELQEKIKEEDHIHLILEYKENVFWCTVENNGNKICTEY